MAPAPLASHTSSGQPADVDVVVGGGGPTGLTLAAELAIAGVSVAVVEQRATQELAGSRAGGLQARTIEFYDQRGVAERFLSAGTVTQVNAFAGAPIDISDFPTRHPYGLALWQNEFERILAAWVDELPVELLRGREVTGFAQDADGVDVQLAGGASLRARYLVACDGGRSAIRKAAGIAFSGWEATQSSLIAEVQFTGEPEVGIKRDARGQHGLGPIDGSGYFRVVVREAEAHEQAEPALATLSDAMHGVWGTDFGVHSPRWLSRFSDAARQAESYRAGRVLLAGDAAHVHSPVGGQGLNTGVQDAANLGWKLAQVLRGWSPDALLDSYHAERHPIAARVLQTTLAQTLLMPDDDRTAAARDMVAELAAMDEPRRYLGGLFSQLGLRYDLGGTHPLVGRRMPDLDLEAAGGGVARLYELLHDARPLFVNFERSGAGAAAPWSGRVQCIDAGYDGAWELPAIGRVEAPAAVLVRPDGYVAWAGEPGDSGLTSALTMWCGSAPTG